MRFQFCPHCGAKTELRETGDEGLVPWCPQCRVPLFPMFSTCIIALAVDEAEEVALLRQDYISSRYHVLVSGYMKPGETAEESAAREIREELGLEVSGLSVTGTYWHEKKDMLMVGFIARVDKRDFRLSQEVDQAVRRAISYNPGIRIVMRSLDSVLREDSHSRAPHRTAAMPAHRIYETGWA